MALGFDFDTAGNLFADLEIRLNAAPSDEKLVELIGEFRRRLSAVESRTLADMKAAGNTDRNNESAVRATRASKREARRATARAAAVAVNRSLSDDLAGGLLGESELDAIASAAAQTGGAGAESEELISRVKAAGPDKANSVAQQWVDEQKTQDEHDARYDRQRRQRKLSRFTTRRGTDALLAEGDTETIDRLLDFISAKANTLYKSDGGRDVPTAKHPRTYDQRRFDAFAELLTETGTTSSDDNTTFHVITHAKDWTPDGPRKGFRLDGRRLPTTLLQRLACGASFVGTVLDSNGEVLFHGRRKRLATRVQFRALVARDRGCVQCGAAPSRCQAHHLMPFNSPKAGQTDIDAMALLCTSCHHELHENNHTLYWTNAPPNKGPTRIWKTRPATQKETAPKHTAAA